MKSESQSEKHLDKQIAGAEAKLAELRKKKLQFLQIRMKEAEQALRQMQSNLGGGTGGGSKKAGSGGPRGPRLTDQQAIERLTKEVKTAAAAGISARMAAQQSGVFYLRAIKLMDANFKKSGTGKWTRYRA